MLVPKLNFCRSLVLQWRKLTYLTLWWEGTIAWYFWKKTQVGSLWKTSAFFVWWWGFLPLCQGKSTKMGVWGEEQPASTCSLNLVRNLAPTFLKTPSVPYVLPPTERSYSRTGLRLSQPLKPLRHIPVGTGKWDLLQIFFKHNRQYRNWVWRDRFCMSHLSSLGCC